MNRADVLRRHRQPHHTGSSRDTTHTCVQSCILRDGMRTLEVRPARAMMPGVLLRMLTLATRSHIPLAGHPTSLHTQLSCVPIFIANAGTRHCNALRSTVATVQVPTYSLWVAPSHYLYAHLPQAVPSLATTHRCFCRCVNRIRKLLHPSCASSCRRMYSSC